MSLSITVYAYKGGQFPESGLHCITRDGKKTIWLNSSVRGTFALNDEAVAFMKEAENKRKPYIGIDGKPVINGQSELKGDQKFLNHLVEKGLSKCK